MTTAHPDYKTRNNNTNTNEMLNLLDWADFSLSHMQIISEIGVGIRVAGGPAVFSFGQFALYLFDVFVYVYI